MKDDTVQRVERLTVNVKELRDLAHGISVIQARTPAGRRAETVERLADVLWRELLDLRLGR
jgi:hypothetical protein